MQEKVKITKKGLEELNEELRKLIDVDREENKRDLAEARAQGDLSENADYDAARDKQGKIESRIKEIQNIIDNHELIIVKNVDKVSLGCSVRITFIKDNKQATYKVVGTIESNPFEGKISNESPLGTALLGKAVGDEIEVKAKVNYSIRINEIFVD